MSKTAKAPLICQASRSQLLVIDVQTRLANAMMLDDMQLVIKNCRILMQAAQLLAVQTLVSEQYPKGLGETVPELLDLMVNKKPIEKIAFSCTGEAKLLAKFTTDKPQTVLAGMEAHICVLQTAMGLLKMATPSPRQVFVAEDAIISRNPANKTNAIARMRDAGCIITNTESIVFEWLGVAQGDTFKQISKLIR